MTGITLTLPMDFDHMLHHRLLSVHEIWHGKTLDLTPGPQSVGDSELQAAYSQEYVKLINGIDQIIVSMQTLYGINICIIKLSILLFYERIFGIPKPMFRYVLLEMGGFVIAYSLAGILGINLQCIPLSDLWTTPSNSPLACISFGTLVTTTGVINIVTDITILSLPMPILWSLQVPKSRRWQLVTVFSLGGL